jgi:5-(carboxyamino)imidazole ribonucleotide mutase
VAIDGADNAAILAAQILAVNDDTLADKLSEMKAKMEAQVIEKDSLLQEKFK